MLNFIKCLICIVTDGHDPAPTGRIKLLHQVGADEGFAAMLHSECMFCGKKLGDWKPMEECPERKEEQHDS